MPQQVVAMLKAVDLPEEVKADLYDAFYGARSTDDLTELLQGIDAPDRVRAALWEMKRIDPGGAGGGEPEGPGAVRRFIGGAASALNPAHILRGVRSAVADPKAAFVDPLVEQAGQAREAFSEGRYSEAAGHGLAAALPVIGPAAAATGERIGEGDVAGGLGEAASLVAMPAAGRLAVRGARRAGQAATSGARSMARASIPVSETAARMTGNPFNQGAARAALADTALRESALPGVVRSGATRAGQRAETIEQGVARRLAGPEGDARVTPRAEAAARAVEDIRTQPSPGADLSAADAVRRGVRPQGGSTARESFDLARGGTRRSLGQAGPAGEVQRALTSDTLSAVGRAAPGAADDVGRLNDLFALREAYRAPAPGFLTEAPGGFATLPQRLAAASVHRAMGPSAQGLYNFGQRASSAGPGLENAVRAAILAGLQERGSAGGR